MSNELCNSVKAIYYRCQYIKVLVYIYSHVSPQRKHSACGTPKLNSLLDIGILKYSLLPRQLHIFIRNIMHKFITTKRNVWRQSTSFNFSESTSWLNETIGNRSFRNKFFRIIFFFYKNEFLFLSRSQCRNVEARLFLLSPFPSSFLSVANRYRDCMYRATYNRDNRKATDIFSLAPRCTRSPPRPSDLDTETSFFYRLFSGLARVSLTNITCLPVGLTKRPTG